VVLVLVIIQGTKLDRSQRKKLLGFRKTKEAAEIVFDVAHCVWFLPLGEEGGFHEGIQFRKRTVAMIKRAMLRIGTVQRGGQDPDGRFDIFPHVLREGGGQLIIQGSEGHSHLSSAEFFSAK
jgi:hypothetical protein